MAMRSQSDMVGDQKMLDATGRTPDEWFALLDAAGAAAWTHTAIAAWLRTEHASPPWWNQAITVRYEQERGLRVPGQKADGTFTATGTRIVQAGPSWALDIATMVIAQKLGADATSARPRANTPNARWTLAGRERLLLTLTPTAASKDRCTVGLTHSGIAEQAQVADAKAAIQDLLGAISSTIIHSQRQ